MIVVAVASEADHGSGRYLGGWEVRIRLEFVAGELKIRGDIGHFLDATGP